jgi:hypothetical protein
VVAPALAAGFDVLVPPPLAEKWQRHSAGAATRLVPRERRGAEARRQGAVRPAGAGQARASGPRFAIWSAMIARWISLVPSQIRSTRSSRKNRSATFSRM